MTERTRYPLVSVLHSEVHKWTDIGWTDCGEHPSEPGWHMLEWRGDGAMLVPACADSTRLGPESFTPAVPDVEIIETARAADDLGCERNDAFDNRGINDAFGKPHGL